MSEPTFSLAEMQQLREAQKAAEADLDDANDQIETLDGHVAQLRERVAELEVTQKRAINQLQGNIPRDEVAAMLRAALAGDGGGA